MLDKNGKEITTKARADMPWMIEIFVDGRYITMVSENQLSKALNLVKRGNHQVYTALYGN